MDGAKRFQMVTLKGGSNMLSLRNTGAKGSTVVPSWIKAWEYKTVTLYKKFLLGTYTVIFLPELFMLYSFQIKVCIHVLYILYSNSVSHWYIIMYLYKN
jgi:hypothetical protein